jgi:hypothetical protein
MPVKYLYSSQAQTTGEILRATRVEIGGDTKQ